MQYSRLRINITTLFAYIYIAWGMWYVFFNASLVLRPLYNILWPGLVILGLIVRSGEIIKFVNQYVQKLFIGYTLFAVICLISLLFSIKPSASQDYLIRFLLALGFALVAASFNRPDIILRVIRVFSLLMLFFSLLQYLQPTMYQSVILPLVSQKDSVLVYSAIRGNEALGLTNGTSQNALYLTIGYTLYAANWMNNRKNKILNGIISLVFFGMIFATGKRNYSVCAIIITILLLYHSNTKEKRGFRWFKLLLGALIFGGIFIFASNYIPAINNVIEKTLLLRSSGDVSNGRLTLYINAWNAFKANMFFGVGIDAASNLLGEAVHNSYLQWLLEFGIFMVPIPFAVILSVPLLNRKAIIACIEDKENIVGSGKYLLTYFLFLIMILISGLLAVPFQWTNIFMLYMIFQFLTCKEIRIRESIEKGV